MNASERLRALIEAEKADLESLFALYDSLPAVPTDRMIGDWEGGCFRTGHAGERQLGKMGWVGKSFRGRNDVDPIVVRDADGKRVASDVLGSASLRSVEYRGTVTATMVYDQHPIFDHFRAVDEATVIGVMDRKGEKLPLFFYLRRVGG